LTTPVEQLTVRDTPANLEALRAAEADLRAAGFVQSLQLIEAQDVEILVQLAGTGTT
jgi:hypothetical protein